MKNIAPALLILLFVYAALSKLLDFAVFRGQLHNQVFGPQEAAVLSYLIPAAELLAAGLLLAGRRSGAWLSLGLMTAFTGYIALVLLGFWSRLPCSCGGVLAGLSWPAHLVFNTVFLLISIAAVVLRNKGKAENLRKE